MATSVTELPLTGLVATAAGRPSNSPAASLEFARRGTVPFETVGVTWASPVAQPALTISVRVHSAKGWSSWADLDGDESDDDAIAVAGVRGGTEPLWVGPSDGVQARIVVHSGKLPADLKLALVNPGSSGYDAIAVATPSAASLTSTASAAGVAEPSILSRAAWGADESKVRNAPTYMPTIRAAVLHHTAGPNDYSRSQVPSIIRGDYAYHLSRGWSDIGYNALVDRFGRIWEGRAGGLNRAVMGAHAGGFNTDTFGVSMIGNYDVARPSAAAISAVVRVMAWKLDLNHRNPSGTTRLTSAGGGTAKYSAGTTVTFPVIMGHRNTGRTACPGRYLYPYLPSIRVRVAALMKAALMDPVGPPASLPYGAATMITARSLAAQSWELDVTAPCGAGRVARVLGHAAAGQIIAAVWNGRLSSGIPARPGRYTLTLSSHSSSGTARPVVDSTMILPPPALTIPAGTPSAGAGGYHPVTPTRLLDTRASGQLGLGPNGRVDVPVLGRAQIPVSGVRSVVLNLTAVCVSDDTSLAIWPSGGLPSSRPVTTVRAGSTRSVLVTARVGANGAVSIGNARGVVELTADVVGYYSADGSPIRSITDTPLYDSRSDPGGPLSAGTTRLIQLPAELGGVPSAQITAVIIDVTALQPPGTGTLTTYRPGDPGDLPTLSYTKGGGSLENLAIVPTSAGAIALTSTGARVNVALDVRGLMVDAAAAGSVGGGSFTAIKPRLILDTGASGAPLASGHPRKVVLIGGVTGVPADATAVLINLTGVAFRSGTSLANGTWLQVYPWGQPQAPGAAVRVSPGETRANLVLVPLGAAGAIAVANGVGKSNIRVDVQGYVK